ncbi:hypothetical protein PFISCL1PPCAC_26707, partial [Pristionchus fissidentatus]
MAAQLNVQQQFLARSDRVKNVDFHPSEPLLLAALYNGNVTIWNYETQKLVNSFKVCDLPVRTAKFVARKDWIITGSDDKFIRVYNYTTLDLIHEFEAHGDFIRCIAVHPEQPFVLTSADDKVIKLWDWDNEWKLAQTFKGHAHYVMNIAINPKDNNSFASASLDKTIKVWTIGSETANFTLEGHDNAVNCLAYYDGDKPYLISGSDDHLVKIWDYENKNCVHTLTGHTHNVSSISFHPELPLIITASEDSTVRFWNVDSYRLESTLNYELGLAWCVQTKKGSNTVALGFDQGTVTIKLEKE